MAANYWESSQFNSLSDIDPYLMVATCMYLASKVEEKVSSEIKFNYDIADIAECESYLLEEMKFYLVVYHPYQVLIDINEQIKLRKASLQAAWSIINDSFRTDLILVYPPHVIALASLFLSRVVDQGELSELEAQQWFADLNVDITDILQVVNEMVALYSTWKSYAENKMPDMVSRFISELDAAM
ncbi:RNA polymerase II holoenzyme cyclin-like subunit [Coemansia sp. RSA 1721]|nr:RNA polymerase II holoenzyme cyclin-like subunit [Coemansia sp. RSA 1721]